MNDIHLIKADVSIEGIGDIECEECGNTATHRVTLDLRANGCGVTVGTFCESCATKMSKAIQSSLPESEEETEALYERVEELEKALKDLTQSQHKSLKRTAPLVLYFPTKADREEFCEMVRQAKPNLKPIKV